MARGARSGWVYAARYRFAPAGLECEAFDTLVPEDGLADIPDGWLLVRREQPLRAAVVGALALDRPKLDPDRAVPFYVEGDSPWRKMDQVRQEPASSPDG